MYYKLNLQFFAEVDNDGLQEKEQKEERMQKEVKHSKEGTPEWAKELTETIMELLKPKEAENQKEAEIPVPEAPVTVEEVEEEVEEKPNRPNFLSWLL